MRKVFKSICLQSLKELGLKEDFASMIANVWSNSARPVVDNVRKQMALKVKAHPCNQLKNVDYSVTVRLGKW